MSSKEEWREIQLKTYEIVVKHNVESTFSVMANHQEEALEMLKEAITKESGVKLFDDPETEVLSVTETAQLAFSFDEMKTKH